MHLKKLILAAILGAQLAQAALAADGQPKEDLGLELVPWSKKIADHRFESTRDFDATVKFYKDKFKGYKTVRWNREVSVPAVKYIHLENLTDSSKWQGVNIYQMPDGRVRYFILERENKAPPSPPPAK